MEREISVSEFKARCLALFDEVASTGETLVVTKRGRRVARIEPIEEPPSLRESVSVRVSDEELIEPLGEAWDADAP